MKTALICLNEAADLLSGKNKIEHPDGSVTVEGVQLFKNGRGFRQGKHAPAFDFTDADAKAVVKNFELDMSGGHEVFLTLGHPDRLDDALAAAWVKSLEHRPGKGVFGTVHVLADTVELIRKGKLRYFSPTFHKNATDEHGRSIGTKMFTGALTNFPHWKGMSPDFSVVALSECNLDIGEPSMDPKEFAKLLASDEAKTALGEMVGNVVDDKLKDVLDGLKTLTEKLTADIPTPDNKKGDDDTTLQLSQHPEFIKLRQRLEISESANEERDLREVFELAARKGIFTKSQLGKDYGTPKFNARATAKELGFETLTGLTRFVRTASPVIELGERISRDVHDDDADHSSRIARWNDPKDPTVIKLAADVGLTPEEFVRKSDDSYRGAMNLTTTTGKE